MEGELTSKPYVDLTLDEMAKFGVQVDNQDYRRLVVRPQDYRAGDIDVEGDASAASYFAALATLHGARITLSNLGIGHPPGRLCVLRPVRTARRARRANAFRTVIEGPRKLAAGFDARRRHDQHAGRRTHSHDARAVPVAPDAHHRSRHAAREGMRPHRRAHARAAQARRDGGGGAGLHGDRAARRRSISRRRRTAVVEIETYHDHRIAMSFGVLGSRLPGLRILDPGCVAKTYPNYWRDWQRAAASRRAAAMRRC